MNIGGYQGERRLFMIAPSANTGANTGEIIEDILGGIALFALLFAGFWLGLGAGLLPDAAPIMGGVQ